MAFVIPISSGILGSHPRISLALVMSGRRCLGSSPGRGRWMIFELEPVCLIASSASCKMVNSPGLPMLTGPIVFS